MINSGHNSSPEESRVDIGVHLTWKDLCVTVSSNGKKNKCKSILQGLTGYARPGEVLAILGPSGCGKSTLLDALAGRLDSNRKQAGDILINGIKQQLAYGTSAYVTQDDILTWTLTVEEAVNYSAQMQLPNTMTKQEKAERAEKTIRDMGLQGAMKTRIGGWGNKGLSNGQKRRVSICIEILTRPKLLFLDEPTSGLDSAASFYVMSRIVDLSRQNGMTLIASLHQPSSDIFGLFDNLFLLSLGRTVYFGPSNEANGFFTLNGFPCPIHQNPSDHYLKTINTDFDEDIEHGGLVGGKICTEDVINLLVTSYNSSDIYERVQTQASQILLLADRGVIEKVMKASFFTQCKVITRRSFVNMYRDLGYYWLRLAIYIALGLGLGTVFYDVGSDYGSIQARGSMLMFIASFLTIMAIGGFPSFVEDMKDRGVIEKVMKASFFTQCKVITRRSFVNMYRDLGYYWLRLAIYIALGLGLGTVFYDVGSDYGSIQARGSMLMFIASFLTIMAIGGFPSFVEDMKVFRRERLSGHYKASVFVIGNTLSSIPYLLIISLIPGVITYYLVGLQRKYDHFIYFASTLFACMMLVESLMMIVATTMSNFLMGLVMGAGIQGLMMLSGGFFRLPNDLPKVMWKYTMYYIAFHRYAYQGLYKNEFIGLIFPSKDHHRVDSSLDGEEILKIVWQIEIGRSKWIDLAILFGMVVCYRVLLFVVVKIVEMGINNLIVTCFKLVTNMQRAKGLSE